MKNRRLENLIRYWVLAQFAVIGTFLASLGQHSGALLFALLPAVIMIVLWWAVIPLAEARERSPGIDRRGAKPPIRRGQTMQLRR